MDAFIDILKVYLISMLSFVLQIIIGQLFFLPDIKKRRSGYVCNLLISVIVSFITSVSSVLLVKLFAWNLWTNIFIYFFMVSGCFLCCYLVYDYQFKDVGLITIASFALQHVCYQFYHLSYETFIQYRINGLLGYDMGFWVNTLVYYLMIALFYTASYFLLSKKFRLSFQDNISAYKIIIVSAITLFVALVLNSVSLFFNFGNIFMILLSGISSILTSGMVLFLIFFAFTMSSNKKKALLTEAFYKEKLGQYQIEKENADLINIKCHDLKKQISTLKDKAHDGGISSEEIDEINDAVNIYDSSISTGNEVIDTIVRQKSLVCEGKGISLTCLIDGKCFDKYKIEDIYSLFANILDNSIEAVDKIENEQKRFISLTATRKNSFVVLDETNYFIGEIKFNPDGSLMTDKKDTYYHGFGTKSILHVVQKHQGRCTYSIHDDRLALQIVLPIENM